ASRALYQLTLQDADTDELNRWAAVLEEKMRAVPILEDVNSDLLIKNPLLSIKMDRDKIASLGLSANQVESAMFNAYSERQISQIYAPDNQYQVILGVAPEFQDHPDRLSQLSVRSPAGALIPINAVAHATTETGPLSINHTGQLASVTISFNMKSGVALSEGMNTVQQLANGTLPSTVSTSFQ